MTESDIYLDRQGKAQAQMYQRTVNEWERQRNRLEMEHGELMSRVDYLSDEVRVLKASLLWRSCLTPCIDCAREAAGNSAALSPACSASVHGPHPGITRRGFLRAW